MLYRIFGTTSWWAKGRRDIQVDVEHDLSDNGEVGKGSGKPKSRDTINFGRHFWNGHQRLAYPNGVVPKRPPPSLAAPSVGGGGVDVCSRSFVRSLSSPQQPKRLGGTSRNVVVFLSFPSATLNITYILHWVIRPWPSHVFIRFIGHRALTSKGDRPVPIRG